MAEIRRAAERAATAPFAVLIEGESGSGKELVARAVHRGGARRDRPFCTLNCAALPDDLVESELFGHARGAFTGAVAERVGVFEEAHTGTLFLDEVGELSPRAQAKLLRVIQEGELRRIGENVSRRIDVRIVSATNRDLQAGGRRGPVPPRSAVSPRRRAHRRAAAARAPRRHPAARRAFLARGGRTASGAARRSSPATVAALARYDWPGNVRELQNVLAALAVRAGRRGVVAPAALPPQFRERRLGSRPAGWMPRAGRSTNASCARRWSEPAAAARRRRSSLGISRQGLTKLMTRLGIADRRVSDRRAIDERSCCGFSLAGCC